MASRTELSNPASDLLGRQTDRSVGGQRGERHRGCVGVIRPLNDGHAAVPLDRLQSGGTVPIPAAEDNPDYPIPVMPSGRYEQWVDGGAGVMNFRPLIQSDAVSVEQHVVIRRRHENVTSFDQVTVTRKHGWEAIGPVQQIREYAHTAANVQNDENRRRTSNGQRRNNQADRSDAAGRSAYDHDRVHDGLASPEPFGSLHRRNKTKIDRQSSCEDASRLAQGIHQDRRTASWQESPG